MPLDLSQRSFEPEWLDGDDRGAELPSYLTDLAWLNAAMLGEWTILQWLRRAVRVQDRSHRLCLLDVGCGDGSLLRAVASWAHRAGLRMDLIGIDVDAAAIEVARARTAPDARVTYQTADPPQAPLVRSRVCR